MLDMAKKRQKVLKFVAIADIFVFTLNFHVFIITHRLR